MCSQDQDSAGRTMLKQVQQNKFNESNQRFFAHNTPKKDSNTSIDLTDDFEDVASKGSKGVTVVVNPPALVAFRGTSQTNVINKPTTTNYVKPHHTVNSSSRLPLRNGKSG